MVYHIEAPRLALAHDPVNIRNACPHRWGAIVTCVGAIVRGVFENVTPVQSSCDLWLFRLKNQTHVDLYYSEAKEIGYDIFLKKNNI